MFTKILETTQNFLNVCRTCEHNHACDECPVAEPEVKPAVKGKRDEEGRLVIASGEDVCV